MTRDEFVRMLATEPTTPNQIGAVHGEFRRLGLDVDRPARLAAAAALLGLDSLRSSRDLSMGQAGYLIQTLRGLAGGGDLAAAVRQARIRTIRTREASVLGQLPAMFPVWQQTALWARMSADNHLR
ncbi:MAG: hypothetical protein ABSF03_20280 [Streptosporangiaceae bacterium]|jgi:hypothetical protein